jgi:hypothetical protein
MTDLVLRLPIVEPDEDLVNFLEETLAQAKSGELRGVVMVKMYRNEETQSVWSFKQAWNIQILGALNMLARDFEDRILETREWAARGE